MANRVVEAFVEGSEVDAEVFGKRKIMGIVGSRPIESAGDCKGGVVEKIVVVVVDRLSHRDSQRGGRRFVVQTSGSPRPMQGVGHFVAKEARGDEMPTVA